VQNSLFAAVPCACLANHNQKVISYKIPVKGFSKGEGSQLPARYGTAVHAKQTAAAAGRLSAEYIRMKAAHDY